MAHTPFAAAALAAVLALAAAPATAAPAVEPPEDFAKVSQVRAALKEMRRYVARQERETGDWRAMRANGVCHDALRRLEDYRTSQAYTPELGEKLWQDCHDAYASVH
mgnify:CR=1 FL=1